MTARSFWLDEAISVKQASDTLSGVVQTMAEGVHPPLFHILLHFWTRTFGVSEIAVRGYAVVWGILAIPAAFWVGRAVYNRKTGLIAAGLVAFSPYLIWYSQEARMYSMMFFFALLSLGFFAVALRGNRWHQWLAYGIATFLGMFTHYFFFFLVLGEIAYYLAVPLLYDEAILRREGVAAFRWRRPLSIFRDVPTLPGWLSVMLVLAASYALWLSRSLFLPQPPGSENALVASATGEGLGYGQAAPELAFRFNDAGLVIVEMVAGFHSNAMMYALVAMWPLIISVFLVMMDFWRPLARRSSMILWSASSVLIIIALGQWQGQVLASRYFIAAAATAVLILAAIIGEMPRRPMTALLAVGLTVSLVAWTGQSFDPSNGKRFDNRQAIDIIVEQYEPGDTVIYEPFYLDPIFTYYMPASIPAYGFPRYGPFAELRNDKDKLIQDLDRIVGSSRRAWVFLSFQDIEDLRGDAYNTRMWFLRNGFVVAETYDLNNVQLILFVREGDAPPSFLLPGLDEGGE